MPNVDELDRGEFCVYLGTASYTRIWVIPACSSFKLGI